MTSKTQRPRVVEKHLKQIERYAKVFRREVEEGRPKGESHAKARFTNDQVRAIREAAKNKVLSIRGLAKMYDVTPGTICHIIKRRTYKDVD